MRSTIRRGPGARRTNIIRGRPHDGEENGTWSCTFELPDGEFVVVYSLAPRVSRRACAHRHHVGTRALGVTSLQLDHVAHVLILQRGRDRAKEALAGDLADGGLVERGERIEDLALAIGDSDPNQSRSWVLSLRSSCHVRLSVVHKA